uniref:Galectin n=1 Tax=Caenorhabditis tropicalis TaxID=1561998 RepID=A0A1I7TVF5_9PELO
MNQNKNNYSIMFRLISNEGILSVNGDFTAAHFGEHDLTIVARDHGEPSLETRARVQISIFGTLITMATVRCIIIGPP